MTDAEIQNLFAGLNGRFDSLSPRKSNPPLVAHYTSIPVLESIMRTDQIWFSNPLFMNDLDELRFGIYEGVAAFEESEEVGKAARTKERETALRSSFRYYLDQLEKDWAFDIYVFCLSEHSPEDYDGKLSMWRAYAAQGNGAALVFETDPFTDPSLVDHPLALTKGNLEQYPFLSPRASGDFRVELG